MVPRGDESGIGISLGKYLMKQICYVCRPGEGGGVGR